MALQSTVLTYFNGNEPEAHNNCPAKRCTTCLISTVPLALNSFVDVALHVLDLGGHELGERAPFSVLLLQTYLGTSMSTTDCLHDVHSLRPLDFSNVWHVLSLLVCDPGRSRRACSKRGLCQSSARNPECCGTQGCSSRTRTRWSKRVVRSKSRRCTTKLPNQLAFLPFIYWYRMTSRLLRLISFPLSFELDQSKAQRSHDALCAS